MTTLLVSMVGHQPMPNLLAIRYLQPDYVLFLHSAAPDIIKRKGFLADLLLPTCREVATPAAIDPWDIRSIPALLPELLKRRKLDQVSLILDLTGGTKAMSIGLAQAARELLQATLIYVESDRYESILHHYRYAENGLLARDDGVTLPELLTLDMFFEAYQGKFDASPKPNAQQDEKSRLFEEDVAAKFNDLRKLELRRSVKPQAAEEIDIVMRCRNQVALVECKVGNAATQLHGVLQLSNLASDRYLGTYTRKILAVQARYSDFKNNAEAARRHDVFVLELPDWGIDRERDHSGQIIWTSAEIEEFQNALAFAFGPDIKEQK